MLKSKKTLVYKYITCEKKPIQESTAKKIVERVTSSLKEETKTKLHQTELTCITRKFGLNVALMSSRDELGEGEGEDEDALLILSTEKKNKN